MCGKNKGQRYFIEKYVGSPPRVREKPRKASRKMPSQGITPACAGKTLCNHRCAIQWRDHPRVCGKNVAIISCLFMLEGSPPRVREKLDYAVRSAFKDWDHPRVCGKNLRCFLHVAAKRGSPPRVREKLSSAYLTLRLAGITPACAGKTAFSCGKA